MITKPVISAGEAASMVKPGQVVHLGGFLGCGTPKTIVEALAQLKTGNLTIVCNDTGILDVKTNRQTGVVPLVMNHQCSRVITSHIGTSSESQKQMYAGELAVELVPQGTLAERIRCAGFGLGGFLTRTGVGTEVQDGKQVIAVDGITYLLELPLAGDIALIRATRADRAGNLVYSKTARNFNPLMATACRLVIAEVDEIVEIGTLDPDDVHTPFIFVHYLVLSGNGGQA